MNIVITGDSCAVEPPVTLNITVSSDGIPEAAARHDELMELLGTSAMKCHDLESSLTDLRAPTSVKRVPRGNDGAATLR